MTTLSSHTGEARVSNPFYRDSGIERIWFGISPSNSPDMYTIVAKVEKYVQPDTELGSRFLGSQPASGKYTYDHTFKEIIAENTKTHEQRSFSANHRAAIENNFVYIFKNGKQFANLGNRLIVYVDHF